MPLVITLKKLAFGLIAIGLVSCNINKTETPTTQGETYADVNIVGAMKNVMWKGELAGIIRLEDMEEAIKMDRLHGTRQLRKIQDVDIPEVTLPVGPGRNLSVLVEAAVRNHILISKGYDASEAFIERQKKRLEKAREE